MIQAPNYVNPYMQQPIPAQNYVNPYMSQPIPAPNYNAVKIDVHNPSVSAPGQLGMPQMAPQFAPQFPMQPQYAPVTNPYYEYPQAQLYNYPQAQQQPYYMPQVPVCQPCMPQQQMAVQNAQPVIQQQNINTPAPMVTQPQEQAPAETPAEAPKVDVVAPQPMAPQVDLNSFIAKLTNPDYEIQANAMEEIANMVKEQPQKATELLDEKIVNALNTIITTDTSKLTGPTPEQIAAREKLMKGEQLSDADKNLATTITPMEQAERNKSYAMFTAAMMQKLYGDEVAKLTGSTVPLTELPGAVTIVEQLKNNENPMVRTSAIEALSYIQQPAYKQDLNTLFSIAKNDQDKNVQEAATQALDKLNKMQAA